MKVMRQALVFSESYLIIYINYYVNLFQIFYR